VGAILTLTIPLRQPEIDNIKLVSLAGEPHQEIVWLYIPVYKPETVESLQALKQLHEKHACSFEGELAVAQVEKIF
jgi:hypothetical protein